MNPKKRRKLRILAVRRGKIAEALTVEEKEIIEIEIPVEVSVPVPEPVPVPEKKVKPRTRRTYRRKKTIKSDD